MKAKWFDDIFPVIHMEDFRNQFSLFSDLTSIQDAREILKLEEGSLRLEKFFHFSLKRVTEEIFMGEREFSSLLSLFHLFCYHSDLILRKKIHNECCLIENPQNVYTIDCKTVFKIFFPVAKTRVWYFAESVLKSD